MVGAATSPGRHRGLDPGLPRGRPDLARVPLQPAAHGGGSGRHWHSPRKPGAILAVDNTFATPLNQQPLEFGASVSIQSATKFIGGHSDLLCGVATTRDEALWQVSERLER